MKETNIYRNLPSVNEVIAQIEKTHPESYPSPMIAEAARQVLDEIRQDLKQSGVAVKREQIYDKTLHLLEKYSAGNLRQVINATGVVLHTNLGRAILSEKAQQAVQRILRGYCNLEIDLETGQRGSRYSHVEELLKKITGAESALVVNNNAAAVFLTLTALAAGRSVIVSRGQLVEIGGSFRVPEILAASGAALVEVGTTNKTKISDYEKAVNEQTALLLKVHTSNYRIVGFTQEVSTKELAALGHSAKLPVVEDLGSGFLVDLKRFGITDEPTVQESVMAGADIVTFSGDKLLGGPQAGIIVGRKTYVDCIKRHPLNRAMRVDKMTLAALEATLLDYLYSESLMIKNPTMAMLTVEEGKLKSRAEQLLHKLQGKLQEKTSLSIESVFSEAGGGSLPTTKFPSWAVAVRAERISAKKLVYELRRGYPAILARIVDEKVLFDIRTITEEDYDLICSRLEKVLSKE